MFYGTMGKQIGISDARENGCTVCGFSDLVAVMHGRDYLSEEVSRLSLAQAPTLTDVVVQLTLAGILHHDHNFVLILKHWEMKNIEINIFF